MAIRIFTVRHDLISPMPLSGHGGDQNIKNVQKYYSCTRMYRVLYVTCFFGLGGSQHATGVVLHGRQQYIVRAPCART